MKIEFSYIRNRIQEHRKDDLLQACYNYLDDRSQEHKPIWFAFLLMKWTYIYGEKKYPPKALNQKRFANIFNKISDFNSEHISSFIKSGNMNRAMTILYSQQFYLQENVYKEKIATQIKLYHTLKSRYNINASFQSKTGFSILDFLSILFLTWVYINIDQLNKKGLYFDGYLREDFLNVAAQITEVEKVRKFLNLLVLDPHKPEEKIQGIKTNIKNESLQSLERSFFTLYPLQYFNNDIKVIHKGIFNYTINNYIYDFLKANDPDFTTEFGARFEKYIELGLKEISAHYINEVELKKQLPKHSNLVDFIIEADNIFIECKAIEMQPYPSVNPTDELLYNSLKDSILKAYFKQLYNVSKHINEEQENWGIILTYKKLFWSQFTDLFDLGKEKYDITVSTSHLPPENVFIIDIHTWDNMLSIVKTKQATIIEILRLAKKNNSDSKTKKQSFDMHLVII